MEQQELKQDFDIRIKDNFFTPEEFKDISKKIVYRQYHDDHLQYRGKDKHHVWFTSNCEDEVRELLTKKVEKLFGVKIIRMGICQYSFVSKAIKTIHVHKDLSPECNFQTIIYVRGNPNIHSGTGFYVETERETVKQELNTHIGFFPNRIGAWTSNVFHAPLSFAEGFDTRYSILTQYLIKEEENG